MAANFLDWLGRLRDSNAKELNRLEPILAAINDLEADFDNLDDDALRLKTDEFRARLSRDTEAISRSLEENRGALTEVNRRLEENPPEPEAGQLGSRRQYLQETITEIEKDALTRKDEALNDLLPEAFAAVREAAKRHLGQRHFNVQLMGGIILHQGKIAEMRTGEGKTLVATLPLYLNSLTGAGCHLVTVNDYLARRDPYWMGPIYHALGVSVASIYPTQSSEEHTPARLYDPEFDSGDPRWRHFRPVERREAYRADILYGTSAEFGFDYLRDNMVQELPRRVQRPLNYAIVDEIDNLLIDEARTPLIISAPDAQATKRYQVFARLAKRLRPERDYEVKEKERSVELTDEGYNNVENMLGREGLLGNGNLYTPENVDLMRHLRNSLMAKEIYRRDRDYVVTKEREVVIVDEFTGRLMVGRRYSEGLHQAIEAKENVPVQQESKTYATITIQNYFRMYRKLSGMTGTAATEAEEFHKIYKLDVVEVPTNKPLIRKDFPDQIYRDEQSKLRAVAEEVKRLQQDDKPVLIGTVSIEKSEKLSGILKRQGIKHQVLNAKNHEREADIIAEAGKPGAVTLATNMAGRGVDIVLGGKAPEEPQIYDFEDEAALKAARQQWQRDYRQWQELHLHVVQGGGLNIIGTERHEARRIDNQLRGRAARQGDPGSSRFFVSLEDDVVRRFGGERLKSIMGWAGLGEDVAIENKMVSRTIENAQVRVEGFHFDIRKHLVEYDDVVNRHREIIYAEREKILGGADLKTNIMSMMDEAIAAAVDDYVNQDGLERDIPGLLKEIDALMPLTPEMSDGTLETLTPAEIKQQLSAQAAALYAEREREIGREPLRGWERRVMLSTSDSLWMEHLTAMEDMRQGIGLQTVAQRDPLVAYKRSGHQQFENLLRAIRYETARIIGRSVFHARIIHKTAPPQTNAPKAPLETASPAAASPMAKALPPENRPRATGKKVGRNAPCPCGSGKKYKHCCGR